MKYISLLVFALFLSGSKSPVTEEPFVLIQLFTSQGCSSCPPADKLLGDIKEKYQGSNVYVLSYHVDYWNRLGWEDPFSQRKFTELQYAYADQFREQQVYTPQVIVNGQEHFVGSNASKLKSKITRYLKNRALNSVVLSSEKDSQGNLLIHYKVSGTTVDKNLKLNLVFENNTTHVTRGENSHRSLSHTNIVLDEFIISLNGKQTGQFKIPKSLIEAKKSYKIIGFVQGSRLEITGADQVAI